MQRKTLIALAAVLASACALPAFAQDTPAHKESRNARGAQLTDVTPEQARANELRRCDNLPTFYKSDCEARVNGQGNNQVQGSVAGGGIFVETRTTMSEAEYKRLQAESGSMQNPAANAEPSPAPEHMRHHRRHKPQ